MNIFAIRRHVRYATLTYLHNILILSSGDIVADIDKEIIALIDHLFSHIWYDGISFSCLRCVYSIYTILQHEHDVINENMNTIQ